MPLPITFGGLAGPIPTNNLDTNFGAVAAMGVLSCTAVGTNALTLSPLGLQAIPLAYANGQRFQFVAGGSNTGAAAANIAGLGARPVYKDTALGPVVCTGGEIIAANAYQIWFDLSLNGGNGGFHLVAASGTGSGSGGSSGGGAIVFLAQQIFASNAAAQFTSVITSTYDDYFLEINGLTGITSTAFVQLQFSTNNGATYDTGGNYDWSFSATQQGGLSAAFGGAGSTYIRFTSDANSGATASFSAHVSLKNLNSTALYKQVFGLSDSQNSAGDYYVGYGGGTYLNAAAVNALQITISTGVITSGIVRLYAIANTNASGGGSGGGGVTTAGVVADARNFVAARAMNTTLTMTTTEVIAKLAPGSSAFLGVNLSLTLNFATTGLNALDTGTVAASTFYGIYFIYNPTTNVWGCIASLNTTKPTTLPAGFTAFALMSVLRTDASAHIVAGFNQFGRTCSYVPINIINNHASVTTLTQQSVSGAVPPIAKSCSGVLGSNTGHAGASVVAAVASDSSGTGIQYGSPVESGAGITGFSYMGAIAFVDLQLTTAQSLWFAAFDTGSNASMRLDITGYTI